jgi:NAD(P)-dependent dehydrogenase (short-subunit alcohol dehydrogenase family)
MGDSCKDRVVVITGAGNGLGRAYALEFAQEGAKVVVNDLGVTLEGTDQADGPAAAVVAEITDLGGDAVADGNDVADWAGAEALLGVAREHFGRVDVVVNNAGILRDRMLVNMTPDEWDAVIRVHLRGMFNMTRLAAATWREEAKGGHQPDARVINTTSPAGLYGNPGQTNYATAKAGIAAFTITAAQELARYGITVNAVSPGARTRMTEALGLPQLQAPTEPGKFDSAAPENVAPLVVWLGSSDSSDVTGRVFSIGGGRIGFAEGWREGQVLKKKGARWQVDEIGAAIRGAGEERSDA